MSSQMNFRNSLQTTAPLATYKTETLMFHSIDDKNLVIRVKNLVTNSFIIKK